MEQERYYFRVGLFVTSVIVLAIGVLGWISSRQGSTHYITYAIYFTGSVDGLSRGSPVKLKGIEVGRVTDIDFASYENDLIRVLVDITDTAPIRTDTIASMQLQGITGSSAISLEHTGKNPTYLTKKPGEEYLVIQSKQSSLEKVVTSIPKLIDQMTKLSTQGQKVLSDENVKTFNQTLLELQELVKEGKLAMKEVPELLKELTKLETQGQKALSDENIKAIHQTVAELNTAVQQMNEVLAEGKTTLREIKMLTKTLRTEPSQILHEPAYKGYKVAP